MAELFNIQTRALSGDVRPTVDARELHAFLGVGKVFAAWIQERIAQYGFEEERDFTVFSDSGNNPQGGRPAKQYALSLDMGKELAMVERTERGKAARQYFLECERRARAVVAALPDFTNPVAAARAWADQVEARERLALQAQQLEQQTQQQAAQLALAAPKVEFFDAVGNAEGSMSFDEVAKALHTGRNRLMKFLRDAHILTRANLPMQQHVEADRFRVIERTFQAPDGQSRLYAVTRVTPRGLQYIQSRIGRDGKPGLLC